MKKFIKKIKSNKFLYILSVLIVGVFLVLIARVTYAFLAPIINEAQSDVVVKGDTVDDFDLKVGNALKIDATPTTLKENGTNYTSSTTATASLKANSTKNTATYNYYLYFQIENNTFAYTNGTTPEIILTITNPNGEEVTSIEGLTYGTFNGVSGFDVTTQSGLFNIANNYSITSNSSTTFTNQVWNITLTYLNLPIDQSGNFGKSMGVNVYLQKNKMLQSITDVCANGDNLATCISTLGSNSKSGVTNIYHHNGTIKSTDGTVIDANDGSYRYAGANPNNYVCFGSDATPCPTDNLYRIIGVFGENNHGVSGQQLVKLIKYDYATSSLLGTDGDYADTAIPNASYYKGSLTSVNIYYWNYKATNSATNTWSTSLLNKTNLNTNFINNIGTEWANKIATTIWKVGGSAYGLIRDVAPRTAYYYEVERPNAMSTSTTGETEYNAQIGLMYVSDYGFAADPSAWTLTMYNYLNTTAKSTNWMYMGLDEWTITRYAEYTDRAFSIKNYGAVLESDNNAVVRPSFSLLSSTTYVSGSGSADNPILIN